jgi:hypothetical protein
VAVMQLTQTDSGSCPCVVYIKQRIAAFACPRYRYLMQELHPEVIMQELERDPVRSFSNVPIRDAKVGAFISLGLGIVCWFAFPVAHLFILGTGGLGLILGLILYWRHRNQTIA